MQAQSKVGKRGRQRAGAGVSERQEWAVGTALGVEPSILLARSLVPLLPTGTHFSSVRPPQVAREEAELARTASVRLGVGLRWGSVNECPHPPTKACPPAAA